MKKASLTNSVNVLPSSLFEQDDMQLWSSASSDKNEKENINFGTFTEDIKSKQTLEQKCQIDQHNQDKRSGNEKVQYTNQSTDSNQYSSHLAEDPIEVQFIQSSSSSSSSVLSSLFGKESVGGTIRPHLDEKKEGEEEKQQHSHQVEEEPVEHRLLYPSSSSLLSSLFGRDSRGGTIRVHLNHIEEGEERIHQYRHYVDEKNTCVPSSKRVTWSKEVFKAFREKEAKRNRSRHQNQQQHHEQQVQYLEFSSNPDYFRVPILTDVQRQYLYEIRPDLVLDMHDDEEEDHCDHNIKIIYNNDAEEKYGHAKNSEEFYTRKYYDGEETVGDDYTEGIENFRRFFIDGVLDGMCSSSYKYENMFFTDRAVKRITSVQTHRDTSESEEKPNDLKTAYLLTSSKEVHSKDDICSKDKSEEMPFQCTAKNTDCSVKSPTYVQPRLDKSKNELATNTLKISYPLMKRNFFSSKKKYETKYETLS